MNVNDRKRKAYSEILKVLNKHEVEISSSDGLDIRSRLVTQTELLDLEDDFGIKLPKHAANSIYICFDEYRRLHKLDGKNRYISWADCGSNPTGHFYQISFPTGAYIFGNDYPESLFEKFFKELADFGASFIDTRNHSLYFKPPFAKTVHEAFNEIFIKYSQMYDEERIKMKKERLLKELADLDAER